MLWQSSIGGKAYTDSKDVVADPKIDAIVGSPPQLPACSCNHCSPWKAGKHVLCEKPMATSAEEAEEMIRRLPRTAASF